MKAILLILPIFMISCSEMKSQLKQHNLNRQQFKVIKIDSTENMYLIQIKNNNIKELILSEKKCKIECKSADYKIIVGKDYSFKIDPLDSYFNDDDFQRSEFTVENVNVKPLTEGAIYISDSLCSLYLIKEK